MTTQHGSSGMAESIHRVLALLVALVMAAGLLTAASSGSVTAQSYGFWSDNGCYFTWSGPSQGFQQTSTCDSTSNMGWTEVNGYDALVHWDGTAWQPQGFLLPTADGNTAFAVLASDGSVFFYLYSNSSWYHMYQPAGGVAQVETTSGWVALTQLTAENDYWAFEIKKMMTASELRGVDIMLQPVCATSVEGCD